MMQRWRAVGNIVSDLTGQKFEPQTSRSRDESVTARPAIKIITKADWNGSPNPLYNCDLGVLKLAKTYQP